ncbi:hypothetical protein GN277_12920 [Lachnospiraceae bacterium WCA-9-b2]|jgi:SOS-response transcriptional repressor LexA|uniref:LexA repressor DNA-binding domain-containing protein n=2 Tax=Sporofaciens musculi TaxID=2681861 RepID=A0A7X3MH22_9FIRM|nr:hypothetical protein [Sporofaciens musculi]MXP76264.1 hypothetical protein [Sporofaciens musculi]
MKKQDINSEDHKIKSVYKFIVDYFKKYGFAPSFRDISSGTGIKSPSDVREKLKKLERAGLIKMNDFQPRTISLAGYKCVKRGRSRDDTRKSNQAKKEVCDNILLSLRMKGMLSDEELQIVEDAFYSTAERYVFKNKQE